MKNLYPFKSNFLNINGNKYHYLDEGQGDPVVMIHGNPTWSFYFRNLIIALRESFRVIVPDHIGCGLSDKPDDSKYSYTLRERVSDLEKLITHLEINKRITFVVHDWGGMIGMVFATRHPEMIEKLVIMNTSAFHLPKSKKFPWQLRIIRETPLGSFLVRGLNAFCLSAASFCVTVKPLQPEIRKAYLAPYDSWKNRIAIMRFVENIPLRPGDDAYDIVSEVEKGLELIKEKHILICWGEKDFIFDAHFLNGFRERFPRAVVHSFPDAGHYVLEDKSSEITTLVKEFLESRK